MENSSSLTLSAEAVQLFHHNEKMKNERLFLFIEKVTTPLRRNWILLLSAGLIGILIAILITIKSITSVPTPELSLLSVNPPLPSFESIWSTELITISFSEPINPKTLEYRVSPNVQTRPIFQSSPSNSFSILPLSGWTENQAYTIVISKKLKTLSGVTLKKEISITFTRRAPEKLNIPNESYEEIN